MTKQEVISLYGQPVTILTNGDEEYIVLKVVVEKDGWATGKKINCLIRFGKNDEVAETVTVIKAVDYDASVLRSGSP
jgi:hypothetical protein